MHLRIPQFNHLIKKVTNTRAHGIKNIFSLHYISHLSKTKN